MSGSSSPLNCGYEAGSVEPAMRLTVRKDLFPEVRLPKLAPDIPGLRDEDVSCVKLETDFEQSIDEIAKQKKIVNGKLVSPKQPRHRKHKQHSRRDQDHTEMNGYISSRSKRKKSGHHNSQHKNIVNPLQLKVKGGKNLNLVSSSECQEEDEEEEEDEEMQEEEMESSEDEPLPCNVKLPLISVPRQSGKPYSHELSQLATKKKKSKTSSKEKRTYSIIPCSGKPRSMLDICSSRSKKKSKKANSKTTYRSQIVDTNTIKIKIRRTGIHETVAPTPTSVADIGQRKSKKKRAASPVASVSSGEEYYPSRNETAASMSVAAPKPRHPPPKTKKPNKSKNKSKSVKTERSRNNGGDVKDTGPQSPWADAIPEEILIQIFEEVVASQGTLPSVIRLSRVCKLWHNISSRPDLWKVVDLAQYTKEKCKTDYKLVWLLENRLSHCQSLNVGQWKVSNVSWVLACVMEYCPELVELSVAGWSRLTPDQLFDLVQGLPKLQRLDLSLTSEMGGSSTCLSAASVARVVEQFGERFTHLTLANNKFTALPQILSSISAHCPNLEVLDISGALANSHPAAIPLEALQKGCPKLRVFRAANAQLVLANLPSIQLQKNSGEGWTQLEELSIAGEAASERVAVGEYRLGDEALARLVRDARRLRLLDLRGLQRLSDSGLVRVPAWDLQHLFLGGCNVTRQSSSCLELICQKWSHSLIELDLSWSSATRVLDDAVSALAETTNTKLKILNLCGSSVSLEPVKKVLLKCINIESINLSSCRALPRGMKRLYTGKELEDLKNSLDPQKMKAKDTDADEGSKKKKDNANVDQDKESDSALKSTKNETSDRSEQNDTSKSVNQSSTSVFQEPKSVPENKQSSLEKQSSEVLLKASPKSQDIRDSTPNKSSKSETKSKQCSPIEQKPDSSSTPRSEPSKTDLRNLYYSPIPKPDSQVQNSPEVQMDSIKSNNSWSLGQFKSTPTHKSDVNPLSRLESHSKLKHSKVVEQCSPTTSLENKPSPENVAVKQDIKNPNSYYGNYSPMPRQDNQFSSQKSPYSTQPSPAQPSPYSTQPSPYSTQPSPYSSQPSPYSAQPSPDTSQIVKQDLQKSGAWNTGNFSPMPKHHSPFSPHPSTHMSPDPGLGIKSDNLRTNPNKTPGQYSPMSRQDRLHNSPYSPRSNVDIASYTNKKSPGIGNYSPLMRQDFHLTSPDGPQTTRPVIANRHDVFGRTVTKVPDILQSPSDIPGSWGIERFNQISGTPASAMESLSWGATPFNTDPIQPRVEMPSLPTSTPLPQPTWTGMSFDNSARRTNDDNMSDSWTLGQFRVEPPHQVHNTFTEQNVTFESLSGHIGMPQQIPPGYLDDSSYTETSRVD